MPSGKYEEHSVTVWEKLAPLSRAHIKVARLRARIEHGSDADNG